MLQRSPTYFFPAPNENELANLLRELEVDETWIRAYAARCPPGPAFSPPTARRAER